MVAVTPVRLTSRTGVLRFAFCVRSSALGVRRGSDHISPMSLISPQPSARLCVRATPNAKRRTPNAKRKHDARAN
jgi:hypothetical protein